MDFKFSVHLCDLLSSLSGHQPLFSVGHHRHDVPSTDVSFGDLSASHVIHPRLLSDHDANLQIFVSPASLTFQT